MTSFLMHMTLHPHIFKKAQQEMDRVVGRERLPTWEDREGLGYLECVFREVLRCVFPLYVLCRFALWAGGLSLWRLRRDEERKTQRPL